MIRTSIPELTEHLKSYRIPRESTVIIHSSLFRFGQFEGGVQRFLRMIEEVFDESCTIVMPAFNWEFTTSHRWDYRATKSVTGILTEHVRKLPGTERTIHPFHSVTVRGRDKERFTSVVCPSSFGPGSPFERLYTEDAYNLSLGSPFVGGASFLHYAEELLEVPYRYHKHFDGEVTDRNGQVVDTRFSMYVRMIEPTYEFVNTWDVLWQDLVARRIVQEERYNGLTPILLMRIRDAHDFFAEKLRANPYYVAKKLPRTPAHSAP